MCRIVVLDELTYIDIYKQLKCSYHMYMLQKHIHFIITIRNSLCRQSVAGYDMTFHGDILKYMEHLAFYIYMNCHGNPSCNYNDLL